MGRKKKTVLVADVLKAITDLEELENAAEDHEMDPEGEEDLQPVSTLKDPTLEGMETLGDAKPAPQPTQKSLQERY